MRQVRNCSHILAHAPRAGDPSLRCPRSDTHIAPHLHRRCPGRLDRRIHRLHAAPAARVSRLRNGLWSRALPSPLRHSRSCLLDRIRDASRFAPVAPHHTAAPAGEQQVMYIMSMPAVEVEGVPDHPSSQRSIEGNTMKIIAESSSRSRHHCLHSRSPAAQDVAQVVSPGVNGTGTTGGPGQSSLSTASPEIRKP